MRHIDRRSLLLAAGVALALVAGSRRASAIPMISIDLDPSSPGVQSSLTVSLGASVDVDVVFVGDGEATFDAVSLDVFFNSGGLVVAALPPPRVGDIAAQPNVFDTFDFVSFPPPPRAPGDPLFSLFGASPLGLGGVSLYTTEASFPVVDPGAAVSLFRFGLQTLAPGTTAVSLDVIFPGDFLLALDGAPVPVELVSAELRIRSNDVPEPASVWLLLLGSFAVRARRRSKRLRI